MKNEIIDGKSFYEDDVVKYIPNFKSFSDRK